MSLPASPAFAAAARNACRATPICAPAASSRGRRRRRRGCRRTARRSGATHFVNSAEDDPVKAVRALTQGLGVDHAFEAVGNAKLCRQAIECLAIRGTATIVGVLPPDATIEFPWMAIRPECKVQT